eukprot:jgi/Psemu1/2156/gm1.2156_g
MDIPNNNTDSDTDSNISQILLSDDDRKPSAQKDPSPGDKSTKNKTPNLGSAIFNHQKNNPDFSSSFDNDDNDSIKTSPNDKSPPTNKAPNKTPPNPRQEAMKALLMKKFPYLSHLHHNQHSLALIKLQTKAINSDSKISQQQQNWNTEFMSQTIKYLDQVEKEFDGAITMCAPLFSSKWPATPILDLQSSRKQSRKQWNIDQLRAKHKGKVTVPSNDTQFHRNRLMTGIPCMDDSQFLTNHSRKLPPPPTETLIHTRAGSLFQPMPKYVRDVKMEAFDRSCKENTRPETCDVLDLMAENLTNQEDSKVTSILKKRV